MSYCCVLAHSAYKMAVVVEGGLSGEKWGVAVSLNLSDDMPHHLGGHLSLYLVLRNRGFYWSVLQTCL